jgi:hypothetical protein
MMMDQEGKTELLSFYFISVPAALRIESLRRSMFLGALCFSAVRFSYLVCRDSSLNRAIGYELDNRDSIYIIDRHCASSMPYPRPSLLPRCISSTGYSGIKQPEAGTHVENV